MTPSGAQEPGLRVATVQCGSPPAYVIELRGEADLFTHHLLEETFTRARHSRLPVIVDLSALDYGDELLLALLLSARSSQCVALAGPICPAFRRRLDTTGALAAFDTFPDLAAALDSHGHHPGVTR